MNPVYLFFAMLSGACLPLQAGMNAKVREGFGHGVLATVVNFVVGLLALLVLSAVLIGAGQATAPTMEKARSMPWWAWIGGLLGAWMVATAAMLAPKMGVTLLFASIVLGQLIVSIAADHWGWVGLSVKEISTPRVVGVLLVALGVGLVAYGTK
jgi:transporter family-2 protein